MWSISLSLIQLICEAYHFVSVLIMFYMTLNCTSVSDSQGVPSWFNRNLLGSMKPLVQSLPSSQPSLRLCLRLASAQVLILASFLVRLFTLLRLLFFDSCPRLLRRSSALLREGYCHGARPGRPRQAITCSARQSRAALGNHVQR